MINRFLAGGRFADVPQGISVSPDAPAPASTPAAPALPAEAALAYNDSAAVSFGAVEGASSYLVTASPGGASASGAASPLVVDGLAPGVPYTFRVQALVGGALGTPSAATNVATPGCAFGGAASHCCGNGVCAWSAARGAAACFCDVGFGGPDCGVGVGGQAAACHAAGGGGPTAAPSRRPDGGGAAGGFERKDLPHGECGLGSGAERRALCRVEMEVRVDGPAPLEPLAFARLFEEEFEGIFPLDVVGEGSAAVGAVRGGTGGGGPGEGGGGAEVSVSVMAFSARELQDLLAARWPACSEGAVPLGEGYLTRRVLCGSSNPIVGVDVRTLEHNNNERAAALVVAVMLPMVLGIVVAALALFVCRRRRRAATDGTKIEYTMVGDFSDNDLQDAAEEDGDVGDVAMASMPDAADGGHRRRAASYRDEGGAV